MSTAECFTDQNFVGCKLTLRFKPNNRELVINEKVYAKQAARSNSQNNFQSGLQRKPNNLHLLADPIRDSLREQLKKICGILCAISSEELITLGMHPSRGYSSLVLIDQLSRLKQCEWNFLLRDTTCCCSRG